MSLDTDVVMSITDEALTKVLEIRDAEEEPATLGLRVEIMGVNGVDYTYDLAFETVSDFGEDHIHYNVGDLAVMIPEASVPMMQGAALDLPSNPAQGGLVIRNPNRPNPLGEGGPIELTGDIADKVNQLLEQRINPGLAAHGGYATLVGVDDDDKVVVTMGGGCQGCAMSAATLSEGIKRAILEAIPEVTDVIDATDHDAGANPFYE